MTPASWVPCQTAMLSASWSMCEWPSTCRADHSPISAALLLPGAEPRSMAVFPRSPSTAKSRQTRGVSRGDGFPD